MSEVRVPSTDAEAKEVFRRDYKPALAGTLILIYEAHRGKGEDLAAAYRSTLQDHINIAEGVHGV